MLDQTESPRERDQIASLADWATESVREAHSARRRGVATLAVLLSVLCIAAPFLGTLGISVVAIVVALAAILRLAALVFYVRAGRRPACPQPAVAPKVTILLPMRGEAQVVDGLVAAIRRLDYPEPLLEVIALLEEGDLATRSAIRRAAPAQWRIVVLPPGRPRNKPRACNVGLALATGEIIAIFDAEDRPEPDQARKALAALSRDKRLAVVQARLGCDHAGAGQPLLARFWGLEYAVLFGAIQPALARLGLPFLLGGTSNWFRADALRQAGGWDAHNVTEDADLGVRLARAGWSSDVVDSDTWEEAPVSLRTWMHQRSRWLKGFAITTAANIRVFGSRGVGLTGALAIAAQLPATIVCAAAHPVGLAMIATGHLHGMLAVLAVAGYLISVALHAAVAQRNGAPLWLAVASPIYWLLHSAAFLLALADLVADPTHWRKTEHGLARRPERTRQPSRHQIPSPPRWRDPDLSMEPANVPAEPGSAGPVASPKQALSADLPESAGRHR
jgi:hypothetical protein